MPEQQPEQQCKQLQQQKNFFQQNAQLLYTL